ncbi:MAG TPA: AAA family ATPase [Candidatus Paceibacterota bacterium]
MNGKKIPYYDLRDEAARGALPRLVGRSAEMDRFDRLLSRRVHSNVLLSALSGVGKTAFVYGWAERAARREEYADMPLLQLETEHLLSLEDNASLEAHYAAAFADMPACVLFIDDFGREVFHNNALVQRIARIYKQLLAREDVHVVLALEPHESTWLEREHPAFMRSFELLELEAQPAAECARILRSVLPHLNRRHARIVSDSALSEIVALSLRFPTLGQLPKSAIRILDESIALSARRKEKVLTSETIARVVEDKTGVPHARVAQNELSAVRDLERELSLRVLGQEAAIAQIAQTLQRAKLGLRNADRPLGSFLLLGPSGVGKTETAKSVAELLFGKKESFVRFDMSEYQQDHTVQRLIGAPAGYVGYEEGGALTSALSKEPHSLILLDEIEKAHPKVFDIFLQVLDAGRISSGQNETVDARHSILMATSNAGVPEILSAYENGGAKSETFVRDTVLPVLAKTFRLEFLNRFDRIIVFKPLSESDLLRVAELEVKKIEKRLAKHNVRFDIEPEVLAEEIRSIMDPRFGARPVKRFVEETCESLVAESLLAHA